MAEPQQNVEFVLSAKDLASEVFTSVEKGLKGLGGQLSDVKGLMKDLATGAGVGLFVHLVDEAVRAEAELAKLGDVAGVSASKMSALELPARLAGTSLDSAAAAVAKLSKVVGEAQLGDESKKGLFKALGIDANDGRDAADRLLQVATAVTAMSDRNVAAYATSQLLGKSFAEIRPLLKQLADDGALHVRSTDAQAASAKAYIETLARWSYEVGETRKAIALGLLPILGEMTTAVRGSTEAWNQQSAATTGLRFALQTIAIVGSDVGFTFTTMGKDIARAIENTSLIVTGRWEESRRLGQLFADDAKRARAELDAWQEKILSLGQTGAAMKGQPGGEVPAAAPQVAPNAAEGALRAQMEFEKNYGALVAKAKAGGEQFAAAMRMNNALAKAAFEAGELDQVTYLKQAAANDDRALARKIAALHEEEALAVRKGDHEREQIAKNGIAAAQAERTAQLLINKARVDAAHEAERDEARLFKQKLAKDVDQMRFQALTEREQQQLTYDDQLTQLKQAYDNKLVGDQTYMFIRESLELQHQAKLGNLQAQGQLQRRQLDQMSAYQQVEFFTNTLAQVTSEAARHNKTMFELNKAANIASAIMSTYRGAAAALEWGFPLGPIFAGIIIAAGLINVAAIKAQSFSGDVASAPAIPTFSANPNTGFPVIPSAQPTALTPLPSVGAASAADTAASQPRTQYNITLVGKSFDAAQVRELMEQVAEEATYGADITVQTVS